MLIDETWNLRRQSCERKESTLMDAIFIEISKEFWFRFSHEILFSLAKEKSKQIQWKLQIDYAKDESQSESELRCFEGENERPWSRPNAVAPFDFYSIIFSFIENR